jgi:copper transport outer membrane protein MctB
MFDLRYHIASLAAVFIALAVGVVIGVAIASGGGVEDTTRSLQQDQINRLNKELEDARGRAEQVAAQQAAVRELMDEAYPALMTNRLADRECGILFLGPIDRGVRSDIVETLRDADAANSGEPIRLVALDLPADPAALAASLASDPTLAAYAGEGRTLDLGQALGAEFVEGGATPLWNVLSGDLVQEESGDTTTPIDCVVAVQSWQPQENPDAEQASRDGETQTLLGGIVGGLEDSGVAVVGVEATGSDPSSVQFFRGAGLSTVDDVDSLPGRVALAMLLAGGDPGSYGTGDAAEAVSPPIEPLPATTVGG